MQGYQLPGVYSASLQCNVTEQGLCNAVGCPSVRLSRLSSAAIRRAVHGLLLSSGAYNRYRSIAAGA